MSEHIQYSLSGTIETDELDSLLRSAHTGGYTSDILARLVSGSTFYVTARHDGRLVGFGRMLTDGVLIAYINHMTVHPEYQRQGIGQRILDLLVQAAADVRSIYLYTNTADSLYLRGGFRLSEKRLYVRRHA